MAENENKRDIRERNFAFVDLEMTGLSFERHEILEIGMVLARHRARGGTVVSLEIIGEYEWKTIPERIEDADPVSLRINGYSQEEWNNAIPLDGALREFSELGADAVMVGHNVAYDFAFLEKAFYRTDVENKFHYHKLDTISIAFAKLHNESELCRFSLRELSEYFGIENENAHTALSDARTTFELYKKLMEIRK